MIIGIDMGGTNIDGVLIRDGRLIKTVKNPVDRNDYFYSIWNCLAQLIEDVNKHDINRIQLSTTICTNAIVEDNVSRVGMILQPGPGLHWEFDRLGEEIAYISGSVDHRGKLVKAIVRNELAEIKRRFQAGPVESIAVVTKFSTRNPEPEQQVKQFLRSDYSNITLGHTMSGKLNFPRRVETAYLNAAVSQTFRTFADYIQQALLQEGITAPVYILKADGGTIDLVRAIDKPVETILSGPAASFMGMTALLEQAQTDQVLLDIGGTTTDIFVLVDGIPVFEPLGIMIDGRKTLVRAIFSQSIGLGGDSHVRFESGELKIGPKRLDRAVAFGGQHITPSDALVYLGKMPGDFPEKSKVALEVMAQKHGINPVMLAERIIHQFCCTIDQTIQQILERFHQVPVYTIRELLQDRKIKPRSVGLIGGPAKALASDLEHILELPVTYPQHYQVANAIGAALAKPTMEINLMIDTERDVLLIPELDIHQTPGQYIDLSKAKWFALDRIKAAEKNMGLTDDQLEGEIVEASSFNMVQGYYRVDKNIRVKAQIRPGLLQRLVDDGQGVDS